MADDIQLLFLIIGVFSSSLKNGRVPLGAWWGEGGGVAQKHKTQKHKKKGIFKDMTFQRICRSLFSAHFSRWVGVILY